eukprot:COSAG01_NODE_705_length_14144_cov_66.242862_18_plen_216_part_00
MRGHSHRSRHRQHRQLSPHRHHRHRRHRSRHRHHRQRNAAHISASTVGASTSQQASVPGRSCSCAVADTNSRCQRPDADTPVSARSQPARSQPAHSPGTPASSCRESGSRTGPRSAAPPADWPPSAAPHHPSSATPCTQHAMGVRVAHLTPADGDAPCQALALQPRAHAGQASGTRDHAWQPQGRRRRHTCTAKGLVGRHRSSSACPGVSILNIS